jgi:hypothetical protein
MNERSPGNLEKKEKSKLIKRGEKMAHKMGAEYKNTLVICNQRFRSKMHRTQK